MDNNEKQFTEQDSLLVIQQMIATAKNEQRDDGKAWILWGWMLFIASILTVINLRYTWVQTFFFWNVLGIVAVVLRIISLVYFLYFKKQKRVKTYTQDLFAKLNIGFFICIIFIITSINLGVSPTKGFALLMGLYAFWMMIYGAALEFKPSIIAAFITWILGFIALAQHSFEVVMLLHAAAALCGYIIPGHIAYKKFKEVTVRKFNKSAGV